MTGTRMLSSSIGAFALVLLVGCAGGQRLSESMGTINREYGQLQDQALLLNIMRRSAGLPAHFASLTTIHGRNRATAGASLTLPFGGDASPAFEFSPSISLERGPNFEVSTQANKEFFRGYLAPVGAATANVYLRQDRQRELVLSLMIERIRLREPDGGDRLVVNTPDQPAGYREFQEVLERLVDQGLTTEEVELVTDVGPEIMTNAALGMDQVLAAREKGLMVEEIGSASDAGSTSPAAGKRRYRLRLASQSARFCFRKPSGALFTEARCRGGTAASERRFAFGDKRFFGTADGAIAVLDGGDNGTIEIHMRSLAEILDYLGEAVREQRRGASPPTVRVVTRREPLFVVVKDRPEDADAAIAIEFGGERWVVPGGAQGGQSGAVLTIVSQLLAQAQSVRELPVSNSVTIVGN